jgi:ceramide glucosyltransferase
MCYAVAIVAAVPFIYYLLAIYASYHFFASREPKNSGFTPPISILKPVRGLDPHAYQNFASYCRVDYPEYEILFCVDRTDPAAPVIEKLRGDFPGRSIRIFYGPAQSAPNDKVARLARLVSEAKFEHLVISDGDVYVDPDYLRVLIGPMKDPGVGAVTCPYLLSNVRSFTQRFQSIGMISDFYPGIFVARELDGVKFALGPTIATTRSSLNSFGGYSAIADRPGDDLLVGQLIAKQGRRVVLLSYAVRTVADFKSFTEFLNKRLRWTTEMRFLRPWGHFGLLLTFGLPWTLLAAALLPSPALACVYIGFYVGLRIAMAWLVGIHGFRERSTWKMMPLIALWDLQACLVWILSFSRKTIHWRGLEYRIENGKLFKNTG